MVGLSYLMPWYPAQTPALVGPQPCAMPWWDPSPALCHGGTPTLSHAMVGPSHPMPWLPAYIALPAVAIRSCSWARRARGCWEPGEGRGGRPCKTSLLPLSHFRRKKVSRTHGCLGARHPQQGLAPLLTSPRPAQLTGPQTQADLGADLPGHMMAEMCSCAGTGWEQRRLGSRAAGAQSITGTERCSGQSRGTRCVSTPEPT